MASNTQNLEHFDHRDLTLGLLAFASSATDVIAFLKLQEVFTSAMTGNTALLGLAIGQGHVFAAIHSLIALGGYIGGVALGALVHARDKQRELMLMLAGEAAFLGLFFVLWSRIGFPTDGAWLYTLIACSAIGMGLQSVAARKVNLDGIPTVVFTSTLTSIVMTLMHASVRGGNISIFNAKRQLLAFGLYAGGAALTAALLWRGVDAATGIPLLAVAGALATQYVVSRTQGANLAR